MKKLLKCALVLLVAFSFASVAFAAENTTLVKFNTWVPDESGALVNDANGELFTRTDEGWITAFGSQTQTTYGPYLVFNRKVDLANDIIRLEAVVNYSSTSGHNGVGFIKTNGTLCGGYTLLTAQNIKNVGGKGGGDGLNVPDGQEYSAVPWTELTGFDLKFVVAQEGDGFHKFYVYAAEDIVCEAGTFANGTLLGQRLDKAADNNFDPEEIVYPAIGGTNTNNMIWKSFKVTYNGTEYDTTAGFRPQTDLPVLTVDSKLIRGERGQGTLGFVCNQAGGDACAMTPVVADSSIIRIDSMTAPGTGNRVVTYTALSEGTTTVKFTNDQADYISVTVTFVITKFPASNAYSSLNVYPAVGATEAYTDGELMIAFDSAPKMAIGGSMSICKKADGSVVDVIAFQDEVQWTLSEYNVKVGEQMARVEGNKVFFTPHFNALEYDTEYYVSIPDAVITATINGEAFRGLSNKKEMENGWYFKTRKAPFTIIQDEEGNNKFNIASGSTITVDGSQSSTATANFRTIYGALSAIHNIEGTFKIDVAAGDYYELIAYKTSALQNITISGPAKNKRGDTCHIRYINCNDMNGSTHTRPVMYINGPNLVLKNISITNLCERRTAYLQGAEPSNNSQAETIYFASGNQGFRTFAAYNCSFSSHQDTILTSGKNWFYDCYIEGDTDYLWGTADACLFEKCDLFCRYDYRAKTHVSYLMVARTGSKNANLVGKGYVIKDCTITVADGEQMYFGRNAGAGDYYDQCAVIDCDIVPEN